MILQGKLVLKYAGLFLSLAAILIYNGCATVVKEAPEVEVEKAVFSETKPELSIRQILEDKLSQLEIPIYKNAEFLKAEQSETGSYIFEYVIPDNSRQAVDAVALYYREVMDELAQKKVWYKVMEKPLLYRDEDKNIVIVIVNYLESDSDKHILQFYLPQL